jgi:hypothetical protein
MNGAAKKCLIHRAIEHPTYDPLVNGEQAAVMRLAELAACERACGNQNRR